MIRKRQFPLVGNGDGRLVVPAHRRPRHRDAGGDRARPPGRDLQHRRRRARAGARVAPVPGAAARRQAAAQGPGVGGEARREPRRGDDDDRVPGRVQRQGEGRTGLDAEPSELAQGVHGHRELKAPPTFVHKRTQRSPQCVGPASTAHRSAPPLLTLALALAALPASAAGGRRCARELGVRRGFRATRPTTPARSGSTAGSAPPRAPSRRTPPGSRAPSAERCVSTVRASSRLPGSSRLEPQHADRGRGGARAGQPRCLPVHPVGRGRRLLVGLLRPLHGPRRRRRALRLRRHGAMCCRPPPGADDVWDGDWHSIRGTFDGRALRLFVDGRAGRRADGREPDDRLLTFRHAGRPSAQFAGACDLGFVGDIDSVQLRSGVASSDRAEQRRRHRRPPTRPNRRSHRPLAALAGGARDDPAPRARRRRAHGARCGCRGAGSLAGRRTVAARARRRRLEARKVTRPPRGVKAGRHDAGEQRRARRRLAPACPAGRNAHVRRSAAPPDCALVRAARARKGSPSAKLRPRAENGHLTPDVRGPSQLEN